MKKARSFYLLLILLVPLLLLIDLDGTHGESVRGIVNYTVNTTDDTIDADLDDGLCEDVNGYCSLRAALEQSQRYPLDTVNIYFDLYSPATIVLHSYLPSYTSANIINDDPLARIKIYGNNYGGLVISGDQDTTIQGLIFENFISDAIWVFCEGTDLITNNVFMGNTSGIKVVGSSTGSGTVHIQGNYSGYNPYTESKAANDFGIIVFDVPEMPGDCSLYIGGENPEDGNVIAGNGDSGIFIDNTQPNMDIFIQNNYIGMVDDTTPEYNYEHGIEVRNNLGILDIGGDYLTQGNLIAGNRKSGIYIQKSTYTSILGNTFSANAAGTAFIPNQDGDIEAYDSSYLRIGEDLPDYGNVIPQGLRVQKNGVNNQNLAIKHNFIGISRNGFIFPKSPALDGIYVNNVTGYPVISFNEITGFQRGIVVGDNSMVPILNNRIYNNSD